jgi:hypothetical protein
MTDAPLPDGADHRRRWIGHHFALTMAGAGAGVASLPAAWRCWNARRRVAKPGGRRCRSS